MRAASFDLETTSLNGNFGIILCGCVKAIPAPGSITKVVIFRGDNYSGWKNKRSDDGPVSKAIFEEMSKYDIWIAHNGVRFDINFLRTRLAKAGRPMQQPKIFDPVRIARRYYRLGYNSLDAVAEHMGVYEEHPTLHKTPVAGRYWNRAALDGDKQSMNYIVDHCISDVRILEHVALKLSYLSPRIGNFGSDT